MRPAPSDYHDLRPDPNDRSVKIVDGALVLKNIQKGHEGYYICKASNGIGGISAVAKIAVQGRASATGILPNSETTNDLFALFQLLRLLR
jgi:hypothetical protein